MGSAIVVNADDLGVSKGANLGILRAHRDGIVTSASMVTAPPFYEHALETCVKACPNLGIGLHFTLTSGRPVSPSSQIPLLIGDNGFFRWRFSPLLRATFLRRPRSLLDQIEIELEAQLQRLISDGIRPDHINSERHVHLIPAIFERVVAAARRHDIPFVRMGRDIGRDHLKLRYAPEFFYSGGFVKSPFLACLVAVNRRRLASSTSRSESCAAGSGARSDILYAEHVASYLYTGRLDLLLAPLLKAPPPDGVLEIMAHPGVPEESRNLDLGNSEMERYLASEDRRREMKACIAARSLVGDAKLTTFGQLARERGRIP